MCCSGWQELCHLWAKASGRCYIAQNSSWQNEKLYSCCVNWLAPKDNLPVISVFYLGLLVYRRAWNGWELLCAFSALVGILKGINLTKEVCHFFLIHPNFSWGRVWNSWDSSDHQGQQESSQNYGKRMIWQTGDERSRSKMRRTGESMGIKFQLCKISKF